MTDTAGMPGARENLLFGPQPDVAGAAGHRDHPPRMGFFTDTSVCIGCKACEVACKEWNAVPEDGLLFTGMSYDNTQGLGADTWRHVAFVEQRRPLGGQEPGVDHHGLTALGGATGTAPAGEVAPLGPDGRTFYVAALDEGALLAVDGATLRTTARIPTGAGAHGIYPSRDGRLLYVSNRDAGSVSVVDPAAARTIATWRIPGGGSPDMGGVSADGRQLWLSGRDNDEVYVFSTGDGRLLARIPVGANPHGLAIFPQPGRYSIGHTGNYR